MKGGKEYHCFVYTIYTQGVSFLSKIKNKTKELPGHETVAIPKNSVQLSPEGEVNSRDIYRDAKRRGIYLPFFTDPKGDSCFSIYQIRWITMKKVTSLSRNFDYNLQTFRWFCQVYFYDFVANSAWIQHFLPTSKHRQAKVRRFLGFCLHEYFIYRSHFVFRQCLETRRHLGSGRKTVNSHRYSELRESIKTRENCYSLIW